MRSRNGNVNWQTGQLTLKNAASTGPLARASASDTFLPSIVVSEIGGAGFPGDKALMQHPPKNVRASFLKLTLSNYSRFGASVEAFPVNTAPNHQLLEIVRADLTLRTTRSPPVSA
jgi:hypothetical protein